MLFSRRLAVALASGALVVPLTGLVAPTFADQDPTPSAAQNDAGQSSGEANAQDEGLATSDTNSPAAEAESVSAPFGAAGI